MKTNTTHLLNIKNFTSYTPEPEKALLPGAAYLKSEDGQDWYGCQQLFSEDTLKFTYNGNGVITCITRDVSGLWPYNLSVAEVPDTDENRRADISGRWGFDGTNIIDLMTPEQARERKSREIDVWRNTQENASYTFKFRDHTWDYGKAAQSRLEPVAMLAKSGQLPPGFFWTDAHNHDIPMTPADIQALEAAMIGAMVTKGFEIHQRQRQMKEEVNRLTNAQAVLDYVVGWPENR
ncbi:DUF4376 domain-containing protein [Salmonella enterica subsp. enterica serovar Oslo]|uniref:DUF4376 domain-containing protein n=1 Tax=Salmonella enterica TaxID=28901 RepID=UPI000FBEF235|nr:DUF4376 domain-containing protein [Salmonella enterica]EAN4326587.1 DUF4376 domain-containing protein [Salmonella enterica]EAN4770426.1 DUF4376 domain-containing protein [Salmonella enterica]EAS5030935.1 DUF4376 domain-containing protein [Salmonella enterica]EAS5670211.1 DUF4376 domain-containing protein [Salmonella enterica]EAT0343437.1 DUF4376 domain-containing protein [Salmonella enterica]